MKMKINSVLIGLGIVGLLGCSSSGVIPADNGTYMITKRSAQAGFGPPVGAKADVYKEAAEFSEKHGKDFETVKLDMTNSGFAKPGSVSLQFKLIDRKK
jgi:hypothetical protein